MKKIAIFASGNGTNAEAIIRQFREIEPQRAEVACVISDHHDAYVLKRAESLGVPALHKSLEEIKSPEVMLPLLTEEYQVDAIALAGFLQLVPTYLIEAFPKRIVNIHPALLPKYGGKGMYGHHVHEAVAASGDEKSGITIHLVNERYDEGKILMQATTRITPEDTAADVEAKVRRLELRFYPMLLHRWLTKLPCKNGCSGCCGHHHH